MLRTFALCASLCVSLASQAAPVYRITDIGVLPGSYVEQRGVDINNRGDVSGYVQRGSGLALFFWPAGGSMVDLGPPPFGRGWMLPGRMNDLGQVIATIDAGPPDFKDKAVIVSVGADPVVVPCPNGVPYCSGIDIDNRGRVVETTDRGTAWWGPGRATPREPPKLPESAYVHAMNENRLGVGIAENEFNELRAIVAGPDGSHRLLEPLPSAPVRGSRTIANAVNNLGVVCGFSSVSSRVEHAVLWTRSGIVDLTPGPGVRLADCFGINDAGEAVGGAGFPFYWSAETGLRDLGELIDPADPLKDAYYNLAPVAINQLGQILVNGLRVDDFSGATLVLTPVR